MCAIMSTAIITNFGLEIKTVSEQIADCLQMRFLIIQTVGGVVVAFSFVIESNGFSVKNAEDITVGALAFGESLTAINRFDLPILDDLLCDYVSPISSDTDDKISKFLVANGYNSTLSFYLSQQILKECQDCINDSISDSECLQGELREAVKRPFYRARILCGILSDFFVNDKSKREELIAPLLNHIKIPCSFFYGNGEIKISYLIPDLDSLLILDCLYCNQHNIHMNECKNCGKFFIPTTRSDEKYCPYKDERGHECRKIGYENKLKTSPLDALYRKIYKTQNSRKNRNRQNVKDVETLFRKWSVYAADLKHKCEDGKITIKEFEMLASDSSWLNVRKPKDV